MSIEHDSISVEPRLDALLRQIVATGDLQPAQHERVRARLGLAPLQPSAPATLTLPVSQPTSLPATESASPTIATPRRRLRHQWLQFALAVVAFIAVGALLAFVFGSGGDDDPGSQPGTGGSPEATATTGSQDPAALPTPDGTGAYRGITVEQARQIVPFEIVVPERVPEGFEPPDLTVVELRVPVAPGTRNYQVEMVYEVSGDASPPQSVTFTQLGPAAGELNLAETESTTTTTINGVEVTRIAGRSTSGDPLLAFTWERDGLHYQIFAAPEGDLTPGLVEDLMLSILPPPSGEFPQIDGAVMVDAAPLNSEHLPFAASDAVGTIHVVEGEPNEVNSYYSVPTQALREAGWSGGGFRTLQYVSYSGWNNGNQIVLITVIPGRAKAVFPDEVEAIDLGPFPDALDDLGDNQSLIYTRTVTCEEPTIEECMEKAFVAVNEPARQP